MRGKTKITLTDSKTGICQGEFIDENLVTNAALNILNPKTQWSFNEDNFSSMLIQATPMWQSLYGGLILWDSTLTEDVTNVIPQNGVKPVGHAGTAYSGTNVLRGTFNENESGAIPNGYRLVWDFGTDRANGTIRSLSLTSRKGGNNGLSNLTDTDNNFFMSPYNMKSNNSYTGGFKPTGLYLSDYVLKGCFTDNVYTYIKCSTKKVLIKEVMVADPDNILLTTSFNNSGGQVVKAIDTEVDTLYPVCSADSLFIDENGKLNALTSSSDVYYYTRIDPVTKTVEDQRAISFATTGSIYNTAFAYWKGSIYVYNRTKSVLEKFDLDGNLLGTISSINLDYSELSLLDDKLFAFNSKRFLLYDGYNTFYSTLFYSNTFKLLYECKPKRPYILSSEGYTIFAPYLATINNLSEPITKSDTQTMKITYELTTE